MEINDITITEHNELCDLVRGVQTLLEKLSDQGRVEFMSRLTEGYCVHCGRKESRQFSCQCTNDE